RQGTLEIGVDGGHDEEVEVLTGLRALRVVREELARHEARLVVEQTSGRVREQGLTGVTEVGGDGVLRAAVRVGDRLAVGLEGRTDLRRRPRRLTLVPGVVHLGTGLTDHEVLDPVGAGPTGGSTRLQTDAPAGLGALVGGGRRHDVVPGVQVAAGPDVRVVPDEALDGRLDEHTDELAVDRAQLDESRRGLLDVRVVVDDRAQVDEGAQLGPLGHLAGTGETGEIRQDPGLHTGAEDGVDVTGAGVLDLDAGGLFERGDHGAEGFFLGTTPGSVHGDFATELFTSGCRGVGPTRLRGPRLAGRRSHATSGGGGATVAATGRDDEHEHRGERNESPEPPETLAYVHSISLGCIRLGWADEPDPAIKPNRLARGHARITVTRAGSRGTRRPSRPATPLRWCGRRQAPRPSPDGGCGGRSSPGSGPSPGTRGPPAAALARAIPSATRQRRLSAPGR